MKRRINEEGMIEYCDNEESIYLEKKVILLPGLNGAIHGYVVESYGLKVHIIGFLLILKFLLIFVEIYRLHQQFPAFGMTSSLCKRWMRCHLIDDFHFPDICIDLLVAYLFLYPQPYFTTYQPQTMFIRFLNFLSSTNWYTEPVVVNFNNEMTRKFVSKK